MLVALALALYSSASFADVTAGSFQFGLTTSLVNHQSTKLELRELGQRADFERSDTSWGIHTSVGLELGYMVTDVILIGGAVAAGGRSQSLREDVPGAVRDRESALLFSGGPKIEAMFSPGSDVRPYIGSMIGLIASSSEIDAGYEESVLGFQMQGYAGLRWFPASSFSIDPGLGIGWANASGSAHIAGGSIDVSASTVSFFLTLGVSGWAG